MTPPSDRLRNTDEGFENHNLLRLSQQFDVVCVCPSISRRTSA
jgi:hypothetical protein